MGGNGDIAGRTKELVTTLTSEARNWGRETGKGGTFALQSLSYLLSMERSYLGK